jgi:thiosulfate/3-mercaptopyruvate sulfurtransferase
LEPWEKVLVDGEAFPNSIHGLNNCTDCHGGTQSSDKETAHQGLTANPSEESEEVCDRCHENITQHSEINLHNNLVGYWSILEERGISQSNPATHEMFDNHCAECHASCGECHVSQPISVGGGLIEGHIFQRNPSMTRNCTACHGSRVGNEYLGKNEGVLADVHFRQGRMLCTSCHTGNAMHGNPYECNTCHMGPEASQPAPPDHRYAGVQQPSCESCHVNVSTGDDDILMHDYHGNNLSCQVCHSTLYTSCDGCHVAVSEETGNPYFTTEASYLGFFIGLNPDVSYERPYKYVPLRHVPIDRDSFSFYGIDLPRFDEVETWKYATPHNIQRITPQTESCNACHGNAEIFLTADKVKPEELDANRNVILESAPPAITSREQFSP